MQTLGVALLGMAWMSGARAQAPQDGTNAANAALQAGQADKALAALRSLRPGQAGSALAHNLRCRVLFTLEQWSAAADECQQAVNLEPRNSDFHLWLGRALGEDASTASFLTAYSLAKRARAEFEQAVLLDPRNADALADLGEFYNEAPSVVGGGTGKAQGVAQELERVDPARGHELQASIADGNHDYGTTEREFKEAIAASKHPAFQWMRLASFYRHTKQWPQMESAVRSGYAAAQRDKHAAVALYNGASVLIKANRDPELAIKMLQEYLSSQGQTEEAPAFVAHVWLARLLAQAGDKAGAERERQAALAMASSYQPAQNLKF